MSRCFPFPPPGYERKHRPEDLNLLKEAEHKEKKHKKEKKDKERWKNKEKEKDGNGEKQRDKKDRKGKHKDKKEKRKDKKDKENRVKDKEKSSISEESTVATKLEEESGEKLKQRVPTDDRSSIVDEAKNSALSRDQSSWKPFQSSLPSQETKDSKFVQELDRRIRDNETRGGSQLPVAVAGSDRRVQETAARLAVRNISGGSAEEKEFSKDKRTESRKVDVQGRKDDAGGNAMVQNATTMATNKVEGISRPMEEYKDRRWEGKEKYRETCDDKRGDKHKIGDRKSHGKSKEKKKEKDVVKTENRKTDPERPKDKGNNVTIGFSSNKGTNLLEIKSSTANDQTTKKRKDVVTNGFLLESELRPAKIQSRPGPYQSMENGRKHEAYQTPSLSASEKHVFPNNVQPNNSERLINGIIGAQKPTSSKPTSSPAAVISDQRTEASKPPPYNSGFLNKVPSVPRIEDEIAEASRRLPHPDSKYFSELLKVPKSGEWPAYDEQEWLFCKKGPSHKLKRQSAPVENELHVWSEAVQTELADLCALPYVIPY